MAEEKRVKKVTLIPSKRHLRKTRVAAYIRVSSKKEIQNGSYETQAKYYEDKIRSNPEWDFAGIYGDRESGTHTENREGFQQLIRDALDKKVDIIICKSVSRWARNTIEGLRTIKELTGNFVNLIFEEENIDTRHLGYQLQLNLQQVVAQMESESISENLKWSYRNRAELGLFTAARGKYFGFNTDDNTFRKNADSRYVLMIFKDFLDGMTMTDIAKKLNELGLQTQAGKPWQRTSVSKILSNEVYVGDVKFQKTPARNVITGELDEYQADRYIKDHHEGIVDRSIWNAVQRRLSENKARLGHQEKKQVTDDVDDIILELIDQGLSGTQIAERLGITISQEKASVRRLKAQGRLNDRSYESTDDRALAVLKLIQENPRITRKEIREALGLQRQNVDYTLKILTLKGMITKDDTGLWVIN